MKPQPLHESGHAIKFKGEGGEDGKPQAMPTPSATANKHFYGRSGKLKAGRPMNLSGNAAAPTIKSKRRTK